jgi:hypothetical protein
MFSAWSAFSVIIRKCPALAGLLSALAFAQSESSSDQIPTFHARSSLVLLDVFTLNGKSGLPTKDLRREDFLVTDNGVPMTLVSFDNGAYYDTRPVALWLVPQCNMQDWGDFGSGLFLGKTALFRPALDHLDKHDTVGVAHWCDNGEAEIDLPPNHDPDNALRSVEVALRKRDFKRPVCTGVLDTSPCRKGEHALQQTLELILENAHHTKPEPVPVIVFLHSDHDGMPVKEADLLVGDVLEASGIVFGIRSDALPEWPSYWQNGERASVLLYLSEETGGMFFRVPEKLYATTLDEILLQLHFRYELAFKPSAVDGKRHVLKVELTGAVKKAQRSTRLRYRPAYIAMPK